VIGFEHEQRYIDLVGRVFGQDEIVPPGITLETDPFDWWVLKRQVPWFAQRVRAAVVGQFSSVGVAPAVQGDRITVIEGIVLSSVGAALSVRIGPNPLTFDTIVGATTRDGRRRPATRVFDRAQAGDQLVGAPPLSLPANTTVVIPLRWNLLQSGQTSFIVQGDVANTQVQAVFWGYERPLNPEELSAD